MFRAVDNSPKMPMPASPRFAGEQQEVKQQSSSATPATQSGSDVIALNPKDQFENKHKFPVPAIVDDVYPAKGKRPPVVNVSIDLKTSQQNRIAMAYDKLPVTEEAAKLIKRNAIIPLKLTPKPPISLGLFKINREPKVEIDVEALVAAYKKD